MRQWLDIMFRNLCVYVLGAQRVLMPNRSQMEFRASDLDRKSVV